MTPESGRLAAPRLRAGIGVATMLVAALLAAATFRAGEHHARAPSASTPVAPHAAPQAPKATIGWVDAPGAELVVGDRIVVSGWALDPAGIDRVELRVDGRPMLARYGLPRPDVAALKPGYPDGASNGFEFAGPVGELSPLRHELAVVAIARDRRETVLARKGLVPDGAMRMWSDLLDARPAAAGAAFSFLMMTSGVAAGGAIEIDTQYAGYPSRTQRIGMSIPILYLRSTRGAAEDWVFDPEFDLTRKCGSRSVVDDNLGGVIRHAVAHRLPVQFILNGGIWGDASCNTPEWDLNDHLEEDPRNVQWSQDNRTFPDDHLKGQTGSTESPQLARTLTYNVYATAVRAYKRRNLQVAARIVAAFAREHPELFVGVALDSDTYMNPFFEQQEVFDYNPGMIRQFRDWLRGSGPYAGAPIAGVPDLSAYRRTPLSLAQVNRIARQRWTSWEEVDPPRRLPGSVRNPEVRPGEVPIFDDPWWHAWDVFRKHIVDLHYDELSTWAHEAGIPRERIYSAQGFIAPDPGRAPFAIRVDSHAQNYDSAGVSIEGAIPRRGHLGAVIYGEAAANGARMEGPHSLFATFARMDPGWAVVEFNAADLKRPNEIPGYAQAYRSFRDMFNYGASEVSAMAWNGSNGLFAGQPGYVPYTSWRNTPAEDAMRDFLVTHADVPRGALLWTFGSARHADDDGWTAARGALAAGFGHLALRAIDRAVTLESPPDLVIRPQAIDLLALHVGERGALERVVVEARRDGRSAWREIGRATRSPRVPLRWPAEWTQNATIATQLRITLALATPAESLRLDRVLLYPVAGAAR